MSASPNGFPLAFRMSEVTPTSDAARVRSPFPPKWTKDIIMAATDKPQRSFSVVVKYAESCFSFFMKFLLTKK